MSDQPGFAPATSTVWIGLGANLGERAATLRAALTAINALNGTQVQRASSLYRSAPVDAGGPDYLNAVAELSTTLAPQVLLEALQAIEQAAGRERPYCNAPRTLDLDIVDWADATIVTATLSVPHPRMFERAFVLLPLAELSPERVPASALHAVQHQAIERTEGPQWASVGRAAG
ncbi:2-amino-4-hydroxy-6-hydroxymethyldihydropteridine diphosphokinase [Simplicispira psychrophila]|uniref:2-amino-4-hydroxy-6- hydroxymethyldihydropteridine diphosphokinase n=1 Tax=Simplicispira psychrophila TaxID=80882 RepID=UPI0004875CB7|nr:2-amino-4-hydroxy-6-hydroxymethyldihydropteridine diphosphokinase [Simplicispira psychrophila]